MDPLNSLMVVCSQPKQENKENIKNIIENHLYDICYQKGSFVGVSFRKPKHALRVYKDLSKYFVEVSGCLVYAHLGLKGGNAWGDNYYEKHVFVNGLWVPESDPKAIIHKCQEELMLNPPRLIDIDLD